MLFQPEMIHSIHDDPGKTPGNNKQGRSVSNDPVYQIRNLERHWFLEEEETIESSPNQGHPPSTAHPTVRGGAVGLRSWAVLPGLAPLRVRAPVPFPQ